MSLPTSLAEYEDRFREHVDARREEGETKLAIPCPFCAARDWYVVALDEFRHSTGPIYCVECERSARFVCSDGGEQMLLVQVAGPDAPAWLPRIRHENPRVARRSGGHLNKPRSKPPNFRKTSSTTRNCHTCLYVNRTTGMCKKYGVAVQRDDVCDTWEARS